MRSLAHQRCFNHAGREAVARCPRCGNFFCRECVVEHDDRILCAACLRKETPVPLRKRPLVLLALQLGQVILSIVVAWFFFFTLGNTLLRLPDAFHETSVWQVPQLYEE